MAQRDTASLNPARRGPMPHNTRRHDIHTKRAVSRLLKNRLSAAFPGVQNSTFLGPRKNVQEMSHFCDACDVLFTGPENYDFPGTVNAGERKNFNAASGCRKCKRKSAFLADFFTIMEIYILKIYSAHNSVRNYY